jgi:hypothetical protein
VSAVPQQPSAAGSGWIGPLRFPHRWTATWLDGFRRLGGWLTPWRRWLGVGLALGVGPVLLDYAAGLPLSRTITALLGLPLLLAAAARDRMHPALNCLAVAFLGHTAAVIGLAAIDPDRLALSFPAGREYWQETQLWITTGQSVKYDLGHWGPVHLQLAAVMLLWGYLSLGLVPLLQGLHEMDLMNFYVGRLLAQSPHPGPGLLLAWHPWSLCRGVGFLFLTWEIASWSLARLTGEPLSSPVARRRRWLLGLGFLGLDAVVKWIGSESVRQVLAAQLA